MNPEEASLVLPSVSVVLPLSSSEEDARVAAAETISRLLDGKRFEIVAVDLLEEGKLQTPLGVMVGKRFMISFRQVQNVVFLHPEYESIISEYARKRRVKNGYQRSSK